MKRKLLVFYAITASLIILINAMHAFWHLNFRSDSAIFFVKLLLVVVLIVELLQNTPRIGKSITLHRAGVLLLFILLLGIPKLNISLNPLSGNFNLIQVCADIPVTENTYQTVPRYEIQRRDFGLNDSEEKIEKVTPLFWIFEWRKEVNKTDFMFCILFQGGMP